MPETVAGPFEELLARVPSERRPLVRAFLDRVMPFLLDSIESASPEELLHALEAPTHVGSLAHHLTRVAAWDAVRALDPLASAMIRASELQEQLLAEASGSWALGDVADHLGISPQAVDQRRRRGNLLAVEVGDALRYPLCQFTTTGTVEGLGDVLRAIETENDWTRLSVLLSPTLRSVSGPADEEPSSLIEALRAGRREEALHAARAWGRQVPS
jgi:hypothetical protein